MQKCSNISPCRRCTNLSGHVDAWHPKRRLSGLRRLPRLAERVNELNLWAVTSGFDIEQLVTFLANTSGLNVKVGAPVLQHFQYPLDRKIRVLFVVGSTADAVSELHRKNMLFIATKHRVFGSDHACNLTWADIAMFDQRDPLGIRTQLRTFTNDSPGNTVFSRFIDVLFVGLLFCDCAVGETRYIVTMMEMTQILSLWCTKIYSESHNLFRSPCPSSVRFTCDTGTHSRPNQLPELSIFSDFLFRLSKVLRRCLQYHFTFLSPSRTHLLPA
jgi:hypothetical protein